MGSTTRTNKGPCTRTPARVQELVWFWTNSTRTLDVFFLHATTKSSFWLLVAGAVTDVLREFVPESDLSQSHAFRHGRVTGLSSGLRGFQPYIIARSFAPLVGQPGAETSSTKWEFLSYYPRLPSTRLVLFSRVKPTCLTTV